MSLKQYMTWTFPGYTKAYVFELLAHIEDMTDEQKVVALKAFTAVNTNKRDALRALFDCVLHPDVVFDLPVGIPSFRHGNLDPDRSPGTLARSTKKLYYFLTKSPLRITNETKRQKIFIGVLESLPLGDAMVLCHVKDQDLKSLGLSEKIIKDAFPDWYKGVETKKVPLVSGGPDLSVPLSAPKRGRGRPKKASVQAPHGTV